MRDLFFRFLVAFLMVGPGLSASPGLAQFYRWVDENGTVWITDDPVKLPKESRGQFEKVEVPEEAAGSTVRESASQPAVTKREADRSAETYIEKGNQRLIEKQRLEQEIARLETELSTARKALKRVRLTDRRGYWFVTDPTTGKKIRASYKDPGAIWSTATWPEMPREERTPEAEERRRIEADIAGMEKELEKAKKKLSSFRRTP